MLKVMIFAIAGVFLAGTALAGEWGGGCSGKQETVATAPSTPMPTTTAQTPIPETAKPESKG